jgi:two-component system, sensor histidine kinase and response regulator
MRSRGRNENIMVVDDEPENLRLLETLLRGNGYQVRSFPRGRLALEAAALRPPDLILLDVNMPEMNGYEVCERLKADSRLAKVPVLFLSALTDPEDKVKAFRSGGVDFISKPFQIEEVYARVETQLKLHGLQRALKTQNQRLEETVELRTRELAEANARLTVLDSVKSDFLRIISHELRTPLNGLLAVSELMLDDLSPSEQYSEFRHLFEQSRKRMMSLLDDALLLTQIDVQGEGFRSAPVELSSVWNRAWERAIEFARSRDVTIDAPIAEIGMVMGEEELLVRALGALLETAVRFSDKGCKVRLATEVFPDSITVMIESYGKMIPPHVIRGFFSVFAIDDAMTPAGDLGLGPALARRILSLYGARVTVDNQEPSGIRLMVAFRRQKGV